VTEIETRYCYRHPDRPTGLSCSECGRPICTDCMTPAPVGLRCPDHATSRRGVGSLRTPRRPVVHVPRARGVALATGRAPVTKALVAINLAIYLVTAAQGSGLNNPGGWLYNHMLLLGYPPHGFVAPYGTLADGQWYRLVTSMFLHGFLLHIAFNMFALWLIGTPVEQYLGPARYAGLYFVSGLAGAAGALLQAPTIPTVGASGAIFGILGSMMILEWQVTGRLAGNAMTWIVLNLVIDFIPGTNISWGGHIGGLVGGILVTLGYARWRGGHASYGRLGATGVIGLVVVAAGSVAVAYLRVRGHA
jgi:membrane associated rhomboid family serine protease